ncbi:membrane protein [Rhodococcus pyridinivorans SB3094]|uniref:Membrane protein n=1 Tax=Rhodococcus pyridinivorans SB3094 TaxID=1435356 RepID=V9X9H1_9NOCA|nr:MULTISPECIES: DUF4389 domain-containing protein [Rhodococcus]AHD20091.1 membrane protein [Rhodococcus pyridinivorans SB3094]MCT7292185.1 DUF4389 domain-containing protein [Rhodococcus sp. PAE-6]
MNVGKVVMLVVGILLVLLGGAAAVGALILGWFFVVQRADGFITGPEGTLRTQTHALVSERLDLVTDDQSPTGLRSEDIGRLLVQATALDPASAVFVGIAPVGEVEAYLSGVAHTVVTDLRFEPFEVTYRDVPGGDTPAAPYAQQFWVASAEGTGTQQVEWDLRDGTWTVVVMNADASAGIGVDVRAGIHIDLLGPAVLALLILGLVLLAVGVPLLFAGAVGLGRHGPPPPGPVSAPATGATPVTAPSHPAAVPYPVHLRGDLDEPLSRWLWLVKWLLAIPHFLVLFFLHIAFVVATFAAGIVILFTGRYPRALFDFDVGVLRWTWRVAFYTYSALATDRYPPFGLHRTDYPADFDVEYPERLSRGLVLIKWWLLAIPHYVVLAVLAGGWLGGWTLGIAAGDGSDGATGNGMWAFGSLLGVLVLFAAIVLLFTGNYPRSLFDFVMGINRWLYRVWAYAALMRDEYPPFRLDQGAREPIEQVSVTPPAGPTGTGQP